MKKKSKKATKTTETKKDNSISQAQKIYLSQSQGTATDQISHLQRTIGNQAVEKLLTYV